MRARIKVVPAEIGGGFGAKLYAFLEPLALLLSKKTGHPVKMVMNAGRGLARHRSHLGLAHPGQDGRHQGRHDHGRRGLDGVRGGAFPGSPVAVACMTGLSPYNIANFQVDGYDVLVNKPKIHGLSRARRRQCRLWRWSRWWMNWRSKCGIDPLDFRIKNAVKEGSPSVAGPAFKRIGYVEVLRGDQEQRPLQVQADRQEPRPGRRHRLLDQRRDGIVGDGQHPRRRHRQPGDRFGRYRRDARVNRDVRGRSSGTARRRRAAFGCGHRFESATPT